MKENRSRKGYAELSEDLLSKVSGGAGGKVSVDKGHIDNSEGAGGIAPSSSSHGASKGTSGSVKVKAQGKKTSSLGFVDPDGEIDPLDPLY